MYLPTQFSTQGQWWSNLATQRSQTEQCFDRTGFRNCKSNNIVRWVTSGTSQIWSVFSMCNFEHVVQYQLLITLTSNIFCNFCVCPLSPRSNRPSWGLRRGDSLQSRQQFCQKKRTLWHLTTYKTSRTKLCKVERILFHEFYNGLRR